MSRHLQIGRPPIPEEKRRDFQINLRLTNSDGKKLDLLAQENDKTLNSFVYELIMEYLKSQNQD